MIDKIQLQISRFEGTTKTKPTTITTDWGAFANHYLLSYIISNVKEQPLFSPCTFMEKRGNDQVIEHFALVLDFDSKDENKVVKPTDVTKFWDELGLEYVLYQTYSCKPGLPCFRAVFPYSEPMSAREYERKKDKIRSTIGQGFEDKSTSDAGRMYFLPTINSDYYQAPEISVWKKGNALNPADPMFDVPEDIIIPAKIKSHEITVPSQLEWWDEFNLNGYDYCTELLREKGWTCINEHDEVEHWAKPGREKHHATIRYYSNSGLQMFYMFSDNAEPFEHLKSYNWSDLANILLFPEEHESRSKSKLWRHLSKHNLVTKKAPTYKIEAWDEKEEQEKPVIEISPLSGLRDSVVKAIVQINKKKDDIDKMYLNPNKSFCLASRDDNILTSIQLKPYSLAVWLETEAIICKENEPEDGFSNAIIQRLGGLSHTVTSNGQSEIKTLFGFSTFPTITLKDATDSKPHYDKQSKKIVCINEEHQAIIRNSFANPSYDKAKSSAEKIRGIFVDTPFMDENDWYKTFALIITPFLTDIYQDSIPLGIIKASQQGSGKTELAKGICAFTGRVNCKDYNKGADTERMLTSYIVDDSRTFVLDNVNGFFEDDFISVLSTSREVSLRQLYKESTTVPNNLMIIAAANNPRLSDDAMSRSIEINIHWDDANPGARKTKYSILPKSYILNNYSKCLSWIMDVLAYGLSCPSIKHTDYKVVTRHSNWERLVQSVLNPIGINPDFARSEEVDDDDALKTFVRRWYEKHKEQRLSVSDLTRLAFYDGDNFGLRTFLDPHQQRSTLNESEEKLLHIPCGRIISKYKNKCFRWSEDNLQVKVLKGRNTYGFYYSLQVLTAPTSETTEPKQMRFDEVPAVEIPEPISMDDDEDIWELQEWTRGGKR